MDRDLVSRAISAYLRDTSQIDARTLIILGTPEATEREIFEALPWVREGIQTREFLRRARERDHVPPEDAPIPYPFNEWYGGISSDHGTGGRRIIRKGEPFS